MVIGSLSSMEPIVAASIVIPHDISLLKQETLCNHNAREHADKLLPSRLKSAGYKGLTRGVFLQKEMSL